MEAAKTPEKAPAKPRKSRSIRAKSKGLEGTAVDSSQFQTKKVVAFDSAEENLHYPGLQDVDPRDVNTRRADVVLIDVRQPEEYTGELGHIPGSQLLPLGQIEEQLNTLPKDKTIVFVCRSGGRSARAGAYALEHGYTHLYNMKGGMLLWNELHLPTEV